MDRENTKYEGLEGPAWRVARAYGIDMSQLEDNLRKTPIERIRAHDRALNGAQMLRRAMREQHAPS